MIGRFEATFSAFDSDDQRLAVDALAAWLVRTFAADLQARPSRHAYVSTLPPEIVARIDALSRSELVQGLLRSRFGGEVEVTPLPETDEVYLSHYNRDLGGDQGLFARHYDGNLRALPIGAVVRALIYLRSSGSYRVVFHTSGAARRFATYDVALLDFHRELHWVEGRYDPADGERILLKCNFLVTPRGRPWLRDALWAVNVGQFYVVKAAMEYSKSPRTAPQRVVGLVCNAVRVLNNVHPLLPYAAALGVPAVGLGLAVAAWP